MKRFLKIDMWAAALVVALFLALAGAADAYTIDHNWARLGVTAGETLSRGDIAAIAAADGLAYVADADDATLRPALGVIGTGAATGYKAELVVTGVVSGYTGLTPGAMVYLSGTAGEITQAAPAWAQPVGVALSATEIYVNFSNYVDATGLTGLVSSTLATNAPNVVNSVWGATNGLAFEGATADAFETTLSPADPTADATVTIPGVTGTLLVTSTVAHDYAGAAADWTLTATEAAASHLAPTNANAGVNAILSACTAGKIYTVTNGSGQILTFLVTGQTGGTVASAKSAVYMCNGTDVVEVYEES